MEIQDRQKGIKGYISGGRDQRLGEARSLLLTILTTAPQADSDDAKQRLLQLDRRLAHRGGLSVVKG